MATPFELDMIQREFRDPRFSLRLWVIGDRESGTAASIHWNARGAEKGQDHSVILDRFTWNGTLDVPRRGVILAMDRLSHLLDELPPLPVR